MKDLILQFLWAGGFAAISGAILWGLGILAARTKEKALIGQATEWLKNAVTAVTVGMTKEIAEAKDPASPDGHTVNATERAQIIQAGVDRLFASIPPGFRWVIEKIFQRIGVEGMISDKIDETLKDPDTVTSLMAPPHGPRAAGAKAVPGFATGIPPNVAGGFDVTSSGDLPTPPSGDPGVGRVPVVDVGEGG